MLLSFSGEVWYWRGPAPWYFVTVPDDLCRDLQAVSRIVSYGWGMVPVTVTMGTSTWGTSLFPKDGRYVVPVKAQVRKAQRVEDGDTVTVHMTIDG